MPPRRLNPRKLLVASVGVATLNYLGTAATACSSSVEDGSPGTRLKDGGTNSPPNAFDGRVVPPTVANLVAPPMPTVSNLMAPPPHPSATADASTRDAAPGPSDAKAPPHVRLDATVANLVAPPRFDATIANLMPPHTPKQ